MPNDTPIYSNNPGRPRKQRRKGKKIECLKCGRIFPSRDRIYNRLCPDCNEQNNRMGSAAEGKYQDDTGDFIMTSGSR